MAGGWWRGTGEIDKVTMHCKAKQAAAAQTSTRRGAIGYRLLVECTAFHVRPLGRRKTGDRISRHMYMREHIRMCIEIRGRGGMFAAS